AFQSHDGLILTASSVFVQRWDPAQGKPVGKPQRLAGTFQTLAFHPGGTLALIGGSDRTARLWDLVKAEPCGEPLPHPAAGLAAAGAPRAGAGRRPAPPPRPGGGTPSPASRWGSPSVLAARCAPWPSAPPMAWSFSRGATTKLRASGTCPGGSSYGS